ELDRAPGDAAQDVDVLAQDGREALAFKAARPQLEHHRTQLLHRAARQLAYARHLARGRIAVALEQRARRLGRQRDAEQPLRDVVVQLAREPVALLHDRELAAALVQARVLDRDRGVRRQQRDQLLVLVA